MATATEAKLCVKCKTDVTRAKRMKDSGGQYWCVGCGTEDSKKKHTSKIVCADCRGTYSPTEVQTAGADVMDRFDRVVVGQRHAAVRHHRGVAVKSIPAAVPSSRLD
jgi:DNA-directed RNA polymerase subunit RPC12/RpoP